MKAVSQQSCVGCCSAYRGLPANYVVVLVLLVDVAFVRGLSVGGEEVAKEATCPEQPHALLAVAWASLPVVRRKVLFERGLMIGRLTDGVSMSVTPFDGGLRYEKESVSELLMARLDRFCAQ